MRRVLPALFLVLGACVAQPPERSPLPDLEGALPEAIGCQINVGDPLGVRVVTVSASGAAAGILEEGDIIARVDGTATPTRPDLSEVMAEYEPGDPIDVSYRRNGTEHTATVTLGQNPNDASRGMIGVTVQTAFETVDLKSAEAAIPPSPTARPIEIGGVIYLFDPLSNQWQSTGVTAPTETRWVSTTTGLYSVTGEGPVQLFDLLTGNVVADDGFDTWAAQRLIGAVGDILLVVVTSDVPDQPGFVNLAIAGFDPGSGETLWVTPMASGFGIPVAAYGSPDGSAFLAVGADPESGDQLGVTLFSAGGTAQRAEGLAEYGNPIGWHDDTSMAYRTSEGLVTVFDFVDGSAENYELPQNLTSSVAATVGDGEHILVVGTRELLLQDLADPNVSEPLATNCTVGRAGDPGWGA